MCGHCCNRIIVSQDTGCAGLCLLPGEEAIFAAFPHAVLPYLALQKPGRTRKRIVAHQMVQEPCPLFDAATKTCTIYSKRPTTCKAYPFSPVYEVGGTYSIEGTCTWVKTEQDGIEYGKTSVRAGEDQNIAVQALENFFIGLNKRMRRTGYTQLLIFNVESREWLGVGEVQ